MPPVVDSERPAVVDRRHVLKAGLAGAVSLALAGCSTGRGSGLTTTTGPVVSPPTGASTTVGASTTTRSGAATTAELDGGAFAQLAASLTGRLVLPADASYRSDAQLFDFRYDGVRPAAIAYCATPSDVAACLAFARDHGITPTPRSGGHSYAGYSSSSGLVVDVTTMSKVTAGSLASVGAGARLIDVYTALNNAGVSIPAGSCPTVGIAGLAMGGGLGVVDRLQGLTCDAIASLQVVTADSRIVTASPSDNSDLYWACRGGGGGNFGVVTEFEFTTFPIGSVALFTLDFPWAAASQVLPAWQRWAPGAPDELWSNCLLGVGGGSTVLKVTGVYVGSEAAAATALAQFTATTGPPSSRFLETTPFSHCMYVEAGCSELSQGQCHLPSQSAGGRLTRSPSLAKSDFLTTPLSDAGVAVVIGALNARMAAGASGSVAYDAAGGAIGRVASDATAFAHRDAICSAQYSVTLEVGDSASFISDAEAWLDGLYAQLRPYVAGGAYVNYMDPRLADWQQAYYGTNLPRLQQVKAAWDPDDVFHFAQGIPLP